MLVILALVALLSGLSFRRSSVTKAICPFQMNMPDRDTVFANGICHRRTDFATNLIVIPDLIRDPENGGKPGSRLALRLAGMTFFIDDKVRCEPCDP
jgi:hypothetical protein